MELALGWAFGIVGEQEGNLSDVHRTAWPTETLSVQGSPLVCYRGRLHAWPSGATPGVRFIVPIEAFANQAITRGFFCA